MAPPHVSRPWKRSKNSTNNSRPCRSECTTSYSRTDEYMHMMYFLSVLLLLMICIHSYDCFTNGRLYLNPHPFVIVYSIVVIIFMILFTQDHLEYEEFSNQREFNQYKDFLEFKRNGCKHE